MYEYIITNRMTGGAVVVKARNKKSAWRKWLVHRASWYLEHGGWDVSPEHQALADAVKYEMFTVNTTLSNQITKADPNAWTGGMP